MNKNIKVTLLFAERLKELRSDKKLSSDELGNIIGVSGSIILKWEKAQRIASIESLSKLADFFGVSSDYLLGRED